MQVTNGLLVRGLPGGPFSGLIPIRQGLFLQPGLGIVMGPEFGVKVAGFREMRGQGARNPLVVVLPPTFQQGLVGRILNQGVFESVLGIGPDAMLVQEFGLDQGREGGLQVGLGHGGHGLNQGVGKLPAQGCAELRDFPHGSQPVQTGHERILQRGRNGQVRQRSDQGIALGLLFEKIRSYDHLGQFFDKQRDAIGFAGDLFHHLGRQGPALGDVGDHDLNMPARQAAEGDMGDMRAERPGRAELRATGQQQQQPRPGNMVNQQAQKFEGRGVAPVQVFDHTMHRLFLRFLKKPGHHRFVQGLLLLLRGAAQRWTVLGMRQGQEVGKERQDRIPRKVLLSQAARQFIEFLVRGFLGLEVEEALEEVDQGVKGAVLVIGQTAIFHHRGRGGLRNMLGLGLNQPRLANAGFTAQ